MAVIMEHSKSMKQLGLSQEMHSLEINGEGKSRRGGGLSLTKVYLERWPLKQCIWLSVCLSVSPLCVYVCVHVCVGVYVCVCVCV